MFISRFARRVFTSCHSPKKDFHKRLTFSVGKFSTIETQSQKLFTNAFHDKPLNSKGNTDEDKVKTQVFEKFELEGLRSVFNDEILTAVSISSSSEDLEKCGSLVGLYRTFCLL